MGPVGCRLTASQCGSCAATRTICRRYISDVSLGPSGLAPRTLRRSSQARANAHQASAVRGDTPRASAACGDRQPGEVPQLDQFGHLRLVPASRSRASSRASRSSGRSGAANAVRVELDALAGRRRACGPPLAAGGSTRMRRMASAAAAKKCPRPSNRLVRRPAAGTPRGPGRSAGGSGPAFSWASRAAAARAARRTRAGSRSAAACRSPAAAAPNRRVTSVIPRAYSPAAGDARTAGPGRRSSRTGDGPRRSHRTRRPFRHRRPGAGAVGGLLGGQDPTGRFRLPRHQSSFRIVPIPRVLVNSELPPLPNRSR